jgi:hypothetical protein
LSGCDFDIGRDRRLTQRAESRWNLAVPKAADQSGLNETSITNRTNQPDAVGGSTSTEMPGQISPYRKHRVRDSGRREQHHRRQPPPSPDAVGLRNHSATSWL